VNAAEPALVFATWPPHFGRAYLWEWQVLSVRGRLLGKDDHAVSASSIAHQRVTGRLSGAAAMSFRKGPDRHRAAGHVFVVSMLIMGLCAYCLALSKHQMHNILAACSRSTW
jgi:hypothetical protein